MSDQETLRLNLMPQENMFTETKRVSVSQKKTVKDSSKGIPMDNQKRTRNLLAKSKLWSNVLDKPNDVDELEERKRTLRTWRANLYRNTILINEVNWMKELFDLANGRPELGPYNMTEVQKKLYQEQGQLIDLYNKRHTKPERPKSKHPTRRPSKNLSKVSKRSKNILSIKIDDNNNNINNGAKKGSSKTLNFNNTNHDEDYYFNKNDAAVPKKKKTVKIFDSENGIDNSDKNEPKNFGYISLGSMGNLPVPRKKVSSISVPMNNEPAKPVIMDLKKSKKSSSKTVNLNKSKNIPNN